MIDGSIDYTKYSLTSLEEALVTIDRDQYPKNYSNLCAAYQAIKERAAESSVDDGSPHQRPKGFFDVVPEWGWRGLSGLAGAYCFWWSYSLFTQSEGCPTNKKLLGRLISELCHRFGQEAGAAAVLAIGAFLLYWTVAPGRGDKKR